MNRVLAALAAVGLLWVAQAVAQGAPKPDVAKGEQVAKQICAACHAADGNSPAAANPKIAGQFPEYLHKQLADFKAQGGKKPARESLSDFARSNSLRVSPSHSISCWSSGMSGWRASMMTTTPARAGRPCR